MKAFKQPKSALGIAGVILLVLVGVGACSGAPNAAALPPDTQNRQDVVAQDGYFAGGQGQQGQQVPVLEANQPQSGAGEIAGDASGVLSDGDHYSAPGATAQDRVILKTASLSLVVENADETIATISKLADDMGGWVVSSSTNQVLTPGGQNVSQGSITVRVPADKLDEAMTRIKSGGGEVTSESVTGEDVTQQYVDLQSRLTNLQAAETQLREIMASASKTQDVLAVYTQLVSTRGDIESVSGQIKYYDESAAYSSISVYVTPKAIEEPLQIAGWSPGRTAENAVAWLVNLLQSLADLVISVVIIGLPLLVVIGIPGWLIWRRVRRRKPQVAMAAPADAGS